MLLWKKENRIFPNFPKDHNLFINHEAHEVHEDIIIEFEKNIKI